MSGVNAEEDNKALIGVLSHSAGEYTILQGLLVFSPFRFLVPVGRFAMSFT